MFLRAKSILVKPSTTLVGVLQRPAAAPARGSTTPRFCSSSSSGSSMDNKQQAQSKNSGDVMSNSFGEGYATRSDEEGFGGIYSDTQQLNKDRKEINENSPEFDKSQGSEVKEKEKGRNQDKDGACN